jgi:5-methylcytosine-specific restriction endonuclease McrA
MPCAYCGATLSTLPGARNRATRDHIWPRSRFVQPRAHKVDGLTLVPCCQRCNTDKGHLTIDEWLGQMPAGDARRARVEAVRTQAAPQPAPKPEGWRLRPASPPGR